MRDTRNRKNNGKRDLKVQLSRFLKQTAAPHFCNNLNSFIKKIYKILLSLFTLTKFPEHFRSVVPFVQCVTVNIVLPYKVRFAVTEEFLP